MKKVSLWLVMAVMMVIVACGSSESEMMKEARNIQAGLLKQRSNLDSTLTIEAGNVEKMIAIMSQDSTVAADSMKLQEFTSLMTKKTAIEEAKSRLADWQSNSKLLPSEEEQKNGVENPFGAEAKDLDILKAIKDAQSAFNDLRSQIESEIQ
jgi:cell division protein YceG involved in septum cleavage